MWRLTVLLSSFVSAVCGLDAVFAFPSAFTGLWRGIPTENVLGPWTNMLSFHVSRASNGDYYMGDNRHLLPMQCSGTCWRICGLTGDNIVYDVPSTDTFNITTASGWQRFYVEGSGPTAGLLWYCGDIRHWFDSEGFAGYSGAGYNDTLAPVRLLARLTLCRFTSGVEHTVSRQVAPCAASVPVADG